MKKTTQKYITNSRVGRVWAKNVAHTKPINEAAKKTNLSQIENAKTSINSGLMML